MPRTKTRDVEHQYFVRTSATKAFQAISDPAWLVRWLADTAELSPRTGGQYRLGWDGGPQHSGTVLEYVPGKRVTLEWAWEGVSVRGTRFQLAVKAERGGTIVSVRHSGFPREEKWTDLYGGAEWGWTYFLMNLKSVLEYGHDLRSPRDG